MKLRFSQSRFVYFSNTDIINVYSNWKCYTRGGELEVFPRVNFDDLFTNEEC